MLSIWTRLKYWSHMGLTNTYIGRFELIDVITEQMYLSGTRRQLRGFATATMRAAFRSPKPKAEFTMYPAPFLNQPELSFREEYSDVHVIMCCISLHVRSGLGIKKNTSLRQKIYFAKSVEQDQSH